MLSSGAAAAERLIDAVVKINFALRRELLFTDRRQPTMVRLIFVSICFARRYYLVISYRNRIREIGCNLLLCATMNKTAYVETYHYRVDAC